MTKRDVPTSVIVAGVILAVTGIALVYMLFTAVPNATTRSNQYAPAEARDDAAAWGGVPERSERSEIAMWGLTALVVGSLSVMTFSVTREIVLFRRERLLFDHLPPDEQARRHEAADDIRVAFSGAPPVADTAATRSGRAEARAIARRARAQRRLAGR